MEQAPKWFGNNYIKECLKYEDLIPVMEQTLADYSRHKDNGVVQPDRITMPFENRDYSYCMVMSALSVKSNALVTKIMTRCPDQFPPKHKFIVYSDLQTGKPLAIMDGEHLSGMKTAAATAVATKWLAPSNSSILAIIGAGAQGTAHLQALRYVYQFKQVRVCCRTFQNAKDFASAHNCTPCETVEEAVKNADVIVTATTSNTPVLNARWVRKGALVNCIGGLFRDSQELDPVLMKESDVYVDDRKEALKTSGDIIRSGVDIKGEIGELILGEKIADKNATIVYKSMGMAFEDVACCKLVYDKSTYICEPKL